MKTLWILIVILVTVSACGPISAQEQQRRAMVGMAFMGYGANIQQMAQNDYYARAALLNQMNNQTMQTLDNQQYLMQLQQINNSLMRR